MPDFPQDSPDNGKKPSAQTEPGAGGQADVPTQAMVLQKPITGALSFFPKERVSLDYAIYKMQRVELVALIRGKKPEQTKVVAEVADALIELDPEFPTGVIAGIKTVLKFGKTVRERAKRKDLYNKVVSSLLEKLLDPFWEFKMTKKDILDTFQANGLERDKVTHSQIDTIYARVKESLQTGALRDLTFADPNLALYIRMKIEELEWSRTQWRIDS